MDDLDRVLKEVERLDREATPGPWRPEGASIRVNLPGGIEYQWATAAYPRDNNLIAHYRTAAPLLAAEVRRLRAEVEQRIAHGNALYDAIVARLAPHFPPGSRDLDWDMLPGTLAALARDRDEARAALSDGLRSIGIITTSAQLRIEAIRGERDELRALWTAEQQEHRQTARECGDARQDVLALRSELEEARLTLAAEQGRQEGAPSSEWRWTGKVWFHPPTCMVVEPAGRLWRLNPDEGDPRRWRLSSLEPMPARAAMLAADAAVG